MRYLPRRTVLLSALAAPAIARAESDYPNRSIRLVIPWPPGASADAFLRTIADRASGWGRPWCPTTNPAPTAVWAPWR